MNEKLGAGTPPQFLSRLKNTKQGGVIMEECDYKCKSCQESCITTASTENLLAMGINCMRYSGVTNEYAEMQEAIDLELNTRDDA